MCGTEGPRGDTGNVVRVGTVVGVVNGDVHDVFYDGAVNTFPQAPKAHWQDPVRDWIGDQDHDRDAARALR
jgi:hypothetical protein